jgi:Protein of unknown function (DUF3710)
VDVVRTAVVVRDDEARPPREALPLRVPTAPTDQPEPDASGQEHADVLRPFERGPEITEVR